MSFQLSKKERDALMQQVYGGFQKNPTYTEAAGVDSSDMEYSHGRAGKIDFYAYGGDARDIGDSEDFYMAKHHDRGGNYGPDQPIEGHTYGNRWRNKDTWKKVAGHLGIDRVDSKEDLVRMYDFVRGQGSKPEEPKSDYKPSPLPDDPYKGSSQPPKGTPNKKDMPKAGDFGTNRPPGSIAYIPPSSAEGRAAYGTAGFGGKTSLDTAIESVADYGNRATDDYFGRFLPEMGRRNTNEAKATGRSILKGIQDFTGKIPELGDPKKLFDYYMGKID